MSLISIVIPCFNEQENIPKIYQEVVSLFEGPLNAHQAEILFCDNHSTDGTPLLLDELIARDSRVRHLRLSRNFGYQANILSGFHAATGDAVVQLDADGEDDPQMIATFVQHWESGYHVVYGVRLTRKESLIVSLQRKIFYRILKGISSLPIPVDAGDFRLVDRRVVEAIKSFGEANPYIRGIIAYSGFRQMGVPYHRRSRYAGESKFSWWDYFNLALDGITAFSRRPLAIAGWIGFVLSILSFAGAVFYLVLYLTVGTKLPGFTTIIIADLFLAGIQLLFLGVLGAYIGRIFDEVKGRPRSILEYERKR